jgi:serine/threonine protein kinase/Flp pilus assembly protein TadD
MASNYPPDPRNAASVGNPVTPQSGSGPGGTVPDYPLPPVTPQGLPMPYSSQEPQQPSPVSPSSDDSSPRRLPQGTLLSGGRYKIEKSLAAGGMGAVYRAIDTRFDDEPCAIKEMLDDFQSDVDRSLAVDWFKREAKLLLKLNHPCIPRVRDFFVEGSRHYLVMDFIEGRTLAEVFTKEGNVPGLNAARGVSEARARSWAQQVCTVLGYLHRQNPPIIFRDLKPSNIMVTDRDEIKLIDFGIARTFQSQRQSTIIMTIGYAPPEQLHGMPEPRSDIYALGATLHRILTFHDAANNRPSIFSFPPVRSLRPDISPAFDQIIMKGLAPALEQRWSSAAEMERAIMNLPPLSASATVAAMLLPPQPAGGDRLTPDRPPMPAVVTPVTPVGSGLTGPGGAYIRTAQDRLNAGRVDEAYASIQQAYVVEPNNPLVHKIFGQVFARRRQPDLAIQAYNRSLGLNPNDPEAHKLVGDVYLYLRKLPVQAIPAYTQSLRLNPIDLEAHQRLATCYEETNQLEPALREYQEALRLAPPGSKRPDLHYAIGQLASRLNQLLLAERAYVEVLTINPADHSTRFLLSQVYDREGKLEAARRECGYVVASVPGNQAAQAMLQRLRNQLGH